MILRRFEKAVEKAVETMELREALAMHPAILSEDALTQAKVVDRAIVGTRHMPTWPPLHDDPETRTDPVRALLAKERRRR